MDQTIEKQLHEALADLPSEDVHAIIAFAQFLHTRRYPADANGAETELSEVEHSRILRVLDGVAELSKENGPPVSNREHDRYLYGEN